MAGRKKQLPKETIDEGRTLLLTKCLWELLNIAKAQTDVVTQRNAGLYELEAMLEAWRIGAAHPWLTQWERQKSEAANRSPPLTLEVGARRQAAIE